MGGDFPLPLLLYLTYEPQNIIKEDQNEANRINLHEITVYIKQGVGVTICFPLLYLINESTQKNQECAFQNELRKKKKKKGILQSRLNELNTCIHTWI